MNDSSVAAFGLLMPARSSPPRMPGYDGAYSGYRNGFTTVLTRVGGPAAIFVDPIHIPVHYDEVVAVR